MTSTEAEVLQLQKKAERQRIVEYVPEFELPVDEIDELAAWCLVATPADVDAALRAEKRTLRHMAALLSPVGRAHLESIAAASHTATIHRFGRTIHMFAPVYLSNECVSECTYCGFQVWNRDIVRRTLSEAEIATEVGLVRSGGFRHVLLVSGEHPKFVPASYVNSAIRVAARTMPSVSVEVQACDEPTYASFVESGCEGVVIYQECYDPRLYETFHLKGNKKFWAWRIGAPERAAAAGMRRVGLGTLIGLHPNWRWEVLALAAHARFLMNRYWRTEVTVALPRMEPAEGVEPTPQVMDDHELAQSICALRLVVVDAGLVLSTREAPALRDGLLRLGVTHMSAGSRTEPGGYSEPGAAQEQFSINDHRSPADVAQSVRAAGYEPVWKESSPALRHGPPSDSL